MYCILIPVIASIRSHHQASQRLKIVGDVQVFTTEDYDKDAIEDSVLSNERVCSIQSPLEVGGEARSRGRKPHITSRKVLSKRHINLSVGALLE